MTPIISLSSTPCHPPRMHRSSLPVLTLTALLLGQQPGTSWLSAEHNASPIPKWVDKAGNISLPKNFRTEWTHLGSWALDNGIHDVYTQPESAAAFRKNQIFPDGAVLVKEVREVKKGVKTTGSVKWSGDIVQWFVMVKDSQGRFKENKLWGDGWGWALFKADNPQKQVAKSYRTDCFGCHIPAAKTDRVFVEGYPWLSEDN